VISRTSDPAVKPDHPARAPLQFEASAEHLTMISSAGSANSARARPRSSSSPPDSLCPSYPPSGVEYQLKRLHTVPSQQALRRSRSPADRGLRPSTMFSARLR
jgi:hypothetical protein